MTKTDKTLWPLASTMVTHTRESSFGGRNSEWGSLYRFSWDPVHKVFMKGTKGDILVGSWSWESYPCEPALAEAILCLCAKEEIRSLFFEKNYDTESYSESFMCGDHVVALHRHGAYRRDDGRYVHLSSFSFQFYAPDWKLQRVSLGPDLSQAFSAKIKDMQSEAVRIGITGNMETGSLH